MHHLESIFSGETRLEARQTKMYVCTLEELYSGSILCRLYRISSWYDVGKKL